MSEIDRLANRLCPILRDDGAWSSKESRHKIVRAILTAMREPSEGMIMEGATLLASSRPAPFGRVSLEAYDTWQRMIDHILNEEAA